MVNKMNNYRKYCNEFEEKGFVTDVSYKNGRMVSETNFVARMNYTKLIKLVAKHTGMEEDKILFEDCAKWLLEEVKEKVKLTQFEYDLIVTNDHPSVRKFNDFKTYQHMIAKGHFKGLKGNYDKSLKWIIENCEVIK